MTDASPESQHGLYAEPSVTVTSNAVATVVSASGEIDLASIGLVAEPSRAALDRGSLMLDLSGVTFLDSTGVRLLVQLRDEAAARGRSFEIDARLSAAVRQILVMTGMLAQLPVRSPEAEA